ncbi:hypothetical protein [Pantoea agglomerans]|uniref:hypothetical protein n=1 Tax=Enterobacter agglomerans TaxID=549 RepID=UPI001303128B|nr:hypothetical protein [Pantoea agglomerans]
MKGGNVYEYYRFGYNYRIMRTKGQNRTYSSTIIQIKDYLDVAEKLSLKVTRAITSSKLKSLIEDFSKEDGDAFLTPEDFEKLKKILDSADTSLDHELQLTKTFQITPKKLNIDELYRGGDAFISINARNNMSRQAILDYKYGCRCVALQVNTAAAFHLMRSIEDCVKNLYFSYFSSNRLPQNQQMWGPMVNALRAKNKGKLPKKDLLDNLDMFRRNYRNPTQHPEKNYNLEESQNLLFSSIVVISEVFEDPVLLRFMNGRKKK